MGFLFRRLALYKDLKDYVVFLYKLSNRFPKSETFGLKSQLTRAATSVLLNYAEGMMTKSNKERSRYMQIAIGSIGEIVAIDDLALDLKYFTVSQHKQVMLKSETIIKR